MKRALGSIVAALLLLVVSSSAGCGSSVSPTTNDDSTTVSIATTTTEAPATWRQVQPQGTSPSARCYQGMVYVSTSGKVIMFGGSDGVSSLEETWSYEAMSNTWTDLQPEGDKQPSAARQMSGAYDPTSLTIITFDGTSWGYDVGGNVWETLGPKGDRLSPARYGASMVNDAKSGRVILFGGTDMSKSYDETWSYDPSENTWTHLEIEGEVPPARSDAGMVYDPSSGKVILFGGVNSDFDCLDDTWSFDGGTNTWTELTTAQAPSARSGLAMAYDRHSGRVVVFGGIDSQLVCYNDTWVLDQQAGTWTETTPSGALPFARGRASMSYVPSIDALVVFGGVTVQEDASGGFGSLVYLDDMWIYGVEPASDGAATVAPATQATTTTVGADAPDESISTGATEGE